MRFFILLTSIFFSLSTVCSASIKDAELESFFSSYVQSYANYFNSETGGDIDVVMRHFSPQTLQVPSKRNPRLTNNRAELAKGFQFFVDSLEKKGAVGIRWAEVQYVKLGERHALASNVAHVYDKEGGVIDVRSSVYSLIRTDQGWQIFMLQSVKPEEAPLLEPRSALLD